MKFYKRYAQRHIYSSSPVWEAWIEIITSFSCTLVQVSSPVWEAWIEIANRPASDTLEIGRLPYGRRGLKFKEHEQVCAQIKKSSPVWEAWIEIICCYRTRCLVNVVSCMGGVD